MIEILIVLAIISIVMAIGLPAIERVTYQRVNSTTRKFVGIVHTIRNDSILLNLVQRLAIDLDKHTWWIEQQKSFRLLADPNEDQSKKPRKKGDKGEEPPSNFVLASKYSKKPVPLPAGVVIDGVLKEREGLYKEGIAYIHFFPNGFNEQAIIYVNKEGATNEGYSLLVRPTGRVDVYRRYVKDFDSAN